MDYFKPDNRKTTYRILADDKKKAPRIIFSITALKWIKVLMDEHDTEIGFYAIVDEKEAGEYYVHNVFYPKHELVTGGTCEISPEGETEIMQYLIDKGREDDIAKIRFWGHKHPGHCATAPSGQDEKQAIDRMNSTGAYLVRAICSGPEISVSFFDYDNKIRFDNIKWEVEEDNRTAIMIDRLNKLQGVLNGETTEENVDARYTEIVKIFSVDSEIEAIKAKVKELKKVNIPNKNELKYYRNGRNYSIKKVGRYPWKNDNVQHTTLLPNRPAPQSNIGLDENDTVLLLDEIDQEIDDFYGAYRGGY